jgi:hypothetical protein
VKASDPSSGKRLSKENEPIGKRLGESGWDRGDGGLEISGDIDIHKLRSWEKENKRRIVEVRQSNTKTRQVPAVK